MADDYECLDECFEWANCTDAMGKLFFRALEKAYRKHDAFNKQIETVCNEVYKLARKLKIRSSDLWDELIGLGC